MTERINSPHPRGFYFILLFLFYFAGLVILTNAQDSNHFFCGSSWGDASGNCDDREHCPGGTDDECSTEGFICFGGTTCDIKLGHGNKFKYANVDYTDISNTRFCGNGWNEALKTCSIKTHCPSGFSEECEKGQSCYGGLKDCNVQDMYEAEAEKEEEAGELVNAIPANDERRNMFCGYNWADAGKKCNVWCPKGQDEDCPKGEGCFGGTTCYADMLPTSAPVFKPTIPPTTLPPVPYDNPENNRFCGSGWGMAIEHCSLETHCPSGSSDDCPAGQTCHGGLPSPECNIVDIWEKAKNAGKPTPIPTMRPVDEDDPTNTKFCGKSWGDAEANCSLDTHCPDDQCPKGFICYGGTKCNSFEMTGRPTDGPTLRPTNNPTTYAPTMSSPPTETPTIPLLPTFSPSTTGPTDEVIPPDDMRHSFWCGTDWADVNKNCHQPCTSGQDTECSDATMKCIAFTTCRPTPKPTKQPTKEPSPPTKPPSLRPTEATNAPIKVRPTEATNAPIEVATFKTKSPTYVPTYSPSFTMNEATISSAPSRKPISVLTTNEPTESSIIIEENTSDDAITSIPTKRPSPIPTSKPTSPTDFESSSPTAKKVSQVIQLDQAPPPSLIAKIGNILASAKNDINEKVLLSQDATTGEKSPTQRYTFDGLINALGIVSKGHLGLTYFYLGQRADDSSVSLKENYGLVNVALLMSQAVVESIKYDVCDEVSWEKDVFGRYPLANSCGQGRLSDVTQSSYDVANQCLDEESDLACPVDPSMTVTAETKVMWAGAPPPFQCFPATKTGAWDSTLSCMDDGCRYYDGQVKGNIDPDSIPSSNSFGRDNVEGCCWWGRGTFPRGSAGTCMIGKLNYYLGKRAYDDGRSSARYEEVDFCKDPSAICRGYYDDNDKNSEIRWMMGLLFWMRNVQAYNKDGFSFIDQLHRFVDSGFSDPPDFFDDVSRIVSRGCHEKSCGNVISGAERRRIFDDIVLFFGNAQARPSSSSVQTFSPTFRPSTRQTISTAEPTTQNPTLRPTLIPTTSKSDTTLNPTASPVTAKPSEYTLDEVTQLPEAELKHRMDVPNNYCAVNIEEVERKCATTLRTCNFGEPLCSIGQACFGNILCASAAQFIGKNEDTSSIKCGDACLRPLTSQECDSGSKMGAFESLPKCSTVRIGELCEVDGECGNATNIVSSCPGGKNVYMKVNECPTVDTLTSTTNETTTLITQNETTPTLILDDKNLTEKGEEDSSLLLKTWWKHEYNEGSMSLSSYISYIFSTGAVIILLLP